MKFIFIKDVKVSFHQFYLAFTTIPIFYYFNPLFFIKREINAFDFAILGVLFQQYLETCYW